MEKQFTKENVIDALYLLSIDTNHAADSYLHSFQKSHQVWMIASELLAHRPNYPLHILTFAAISLAKKTKEDFHLLSMSDLSYLKEELIQNLVNAAMIPESNSLVVQLGICLSALGLMAPVLLDELDDFMRQLSGRPEYVMALLEVLRILPEEARSSALQRKVECLASVHEQLRLQSSNVLNVLEGFLERQDLPDTCLLKCLRVFGSWTRYGFILTDQVLERKLFQRAHAILVDPLIEGHLEAADCVVAMLENSLVRKDLDSRLFEMVISLEPAFQRSVGNQQLLQNYCHILVNLFETHFQLTKRNPAKIQERFLTIELLLLIAVHCPLSVIESSMDMWSLLSADLDYKADPEMTSSYRPYFLRLLKILFTITQVPESCEDMALPGPMDRFRGLVAEVLVDVAHLVELDTMQELYDIVENEQSAWTEVEMAMFFLRNLMRNFKRHQEQLILSILESVKNRRQPLIRLQILELISTPGVVDPGTIFNCLLKELRQEVPMLARIVCSLCLLMPHWRYLLTLALSVDEFRLKESDRSDLLESVCTLVRQLGPSCVLEANKYLVNERRNCEGSGTRQNRIHMIQIHLSFERDT